MRTIAMDWIARAKALDLRIDNLIDGKWTKFSACEFIEKCNPRDGRPLYHIPVTTSVDVESAVFATRLSHEDGRWSRLPVSRRGAILCRLADLIEENAADLALLEALDVGKPISDALGIDLPMAAAILRYNGELADKVCGRVYGADRASLSYELQRPVGVVAAILGWNFPLVMAAGKIGPALAAGNSVLLKPSELTSLSANRLAELALEAGVPDGVFNVVHGDRSTGEALAHHPDIDLLSFTGSTKTGKALLAASAKSNMKRLILECGGKAANIVFNDCPDIDRVADEVFSKAFFNQGQVCTASSRLLVHKDIAQDLTERLVQRLSRMQVGDPLLPDTRFGPVVSLSHLEKIETAIQQGRTDGAERVIAETSAPPLNSGYYLNPVIFKNVSPLQALAQEEIFGPVLSILSFEDDNEAVRIANNTIYGLSAICWTTDAKRASGLLHQLRAGWITINFTERPSGGLGPGAMPVGGHKQSGIGVEGGERGLEEYMARSAIQLFF